MGNRLSLWLTVRLTVKLSWWLNRLSMLDWWHINKLFLFGLLQGLLLPFIGQSSILLLHFTFFFLLLDFSLLLFEIHPVLLFFNLLLSSDSLLFLLFSSLSLLHLLLQHSLHFQFLPLPIFIHILTFDLSRQDPCFRVATDYDHPD